jgi:AraC-like DNA-binding protein
MNNPPAAVVECIVTELDHAQAELQSLPGNRVCQRAKNRIERAAHLCARMGESVFSSRSRQSPDGWLESFRTEVRGALADGAPSIEVAAEMAGMSSRTLQRRLAKEGLTYKGLLDQLRFLHALTMAEGSDASIGEIARLLGYSATPHFSRAFRRWTGTTFRTLRNRLISGRAFRSLDWAQPLK